ncbi:hypothetical protein [Sulfobacillus sp. hq2]|nr:hypothetical protein [Sulfobacillus sp. hq2]POB10874.1 hypothetical protein CO251_08705 [Sulfobacillus sp. hq2]
MGGFSTGKVRNGVGDTPPLANSKGIRREAESGGSSRQNLDPEEHELHIRPAAKSCGKPKLTSGTVTWAVDIELKAVFGHANHDMLMARVARESPTSYAALPRSQSVNPRSRRTERGRHPTGGPLTPLLAHILLDDFDRELTKRGHRFVRYATVLTSM